MRNSRHEYQRREAERNQIRNNQKSRLSKFNLHPVFHQLREASKVVLNDSEWIKINSEYLPVKASWNPSSHRFVHKYRSQRPNTEHLYHGTKIESAALILARQGLTLNSKKNIAPYTHGGMFGNAIYLGKREKAQAYLGYGEWGVMIEVEVNLGKVHEADQSGNYSDVCDTVFAPRGWAGSWNGSLANAEWAVYNPKRVVILAFEVVNTKKLFRY